MTPLDVLTVINYLNAFGQGPLPPPPPGPPPYLDVSGDGFVTPLDVLLIINYLNLHPTASAEGESAAPLVVLLASARPARTAHQADLLQTQDVFAVLARIPTPDPKVPAQLLPSVGFGMVSRVPAPEAIWSGNRFAQGLPDVAFARRYPLAAATPVGSQHDTVFEEAEEALDATDGEDFLQLLAEDFAARTPRPAPREVWFGQLR